MKKLLALLLALAMVFTLAACGNKESSDKNHKEDTDEEETTKYLLVKAEIDGEELSQEDMEQEFGDDSYIEICQDGTATLQLEGNKSDMEWEDDEIWAEDDEETVYEIKIKDTTVTLTMELDDEEAILTFQAEEDTEDETEEETEEENEEKEV